MESKTSGLLRSWLLVWPVEWLLHPPGTKKIQAPFTDGWLNRGWSSLTWHDKTPGLSAVVSPVNRGLTSQVLFCMALICSLAAGVGSGEIPLEACHNATKNDREARIRWCYILFPSWLRRGATEIVHRFCGFGHWKLGKVGTSRDQKKAFSGSGVKKKSMKSSSQRHQW